MVWGAISYHGQSNLLRIEGNLNGNMYVREVLHPEVVPLLQGIPGVIFQQDNARPYVAKTVGRRLARDPSPAVSKDELLLHKQAIWNSLPQTDIQNLFDSIPYRVAALIAVRGGYTKY
ncbi:transposable element Tc1 transposase [Trichonephila clavipes]|nr:transposable element Tc1 transposase [Trichonephila clavipes]